MHVPMRICILACCLACTTADGHRRKVPSIISMNTVATPSRGLAITTSGPSAVTAVRSSTSQAVLTTLLTVSVAAVGGDLLSQTTEGSLWDPLRTLRFAAVRVLCAAPLYAAWLHVLEQVGQLVPRGGCRTTAKVVLDCFVYSPVYQLLFFSCMAAADGYAPNAAFRRSLLMLPETLLASWKFWVPVQAVTFAACPLHLRVAWVHAVGLVWNAVMSSFAVAGVVTVVD